MVFLFKLSKKLRFEDLIFVFFTENTIKPQRFAKKRSQLQFLILNSAFLIPYIKLVEMFIFIHGMVIDNRIVNKTNATEPKADMKMLTLVFTKLDAQKR